VVLLLLAEMALPKYNLTPVEKATAVAQQGVSNSHLAKSYLSTKAEPAAGFIGGDARAEAVTAQLVASPDAMSGRKIVRNSSLEMVVQHPAEAADQIAALAESFGGYVVSSEGGGQNAKAGTLTIRVPAGRFEQVRAEIRKLGLRIESEKIDAQDVSQQYVDQESNLRNLRAEETQYLAILRQANTVKDMLAVSAQLSEVRGQIEQQQAEFNALSQQVDTVAFTISLRTESEAQIWGLNWRPAYQLELALREGLESVATYATAMTSILFYLPAALLWLGTITAGALGAWRVTRWVGRRWFVAKTAEPARG
jgi:cell division protein FtsL